MLPPLAALMRARVAHFACRRGAALERELARQEIAVAHVERARHEAAHVDARAGAHHDAGRVDQPQRAVGLDLPVDLRWIATRRARQQRRRSVRAGGCRPPRREPTLKVEKLTSACGVVWLMFSVVPLREMAALPEVTFHPPGKAPGLDLRLQRGAHGHAQGCDDERKLAESEAHAWRVPSSCVQYASTALNCARQSPFFSVVEVPASMTRATSRRTFRSRVQT